MCVFIFYTSFVWKISHSKKKTERDVITKSVLVVIQSTRYSCRILMKLEFSRKIFEKYPNIKFHVMTPS